MQVPLTLLQPAQAPLCRQVTRGAPLLPAQVPALHVAVHTVPTVLVAGQLKVAFVTLAGLAEHTAGVTWQHKQA
jgi:hypothetical protein